MKTFYDTKNKKEKRDHIYEIVKKDKYKLPLSYFKKTDTTVVTNFEANLEFRKNGKYYPNKNLLRKKSFISAGITVNFNTEKIKKKYTQPK